MSTHQLVRTGRAKQRQITGRSVTTAAGITVGIFVVVAVLAPLLAPHDPNAVDPLAVYQGPSPSHPLGTDDTGRDLLSRLLYGARPSLIAPALVVLLSTTVGCTLAIVAAWFGGWVDRIISGILDVIFGFPGLIMAVVAAAVFGSGLTAPVIALSLAYLPFIARIVRSAALRERNLPYVAALTLLGASTWRIWTRHLLPNLLPLVVVQAAIGFGYALLDVAAISFIGLGSQPPAAEWGLMVANGAPGILSGHIAQSALAGLLIVVVVVAFNLLGSGLSRRTQGDER